jgi:hypothetical protein
MEAEDPLSQLRDIHLPGDVTFWPPAPGWWLLLALFIVGLVYAYRQAIAALIERRRLASVLSELDQAFDLYSEQSAFDNHRNQAGLEYLATINTLLNRVALVRYPQACTGSMTGSEWLRFLDSCDNTQVFTQGAGTILEDGIYRRNFDAETQSLHTITRTWVENRYRIQESKPSIFASFRKTAT